MREREPEFRSKGAEIVVVLCQKRTAVAAWLEAHPLPFTVVVDEDRSIARRWGAYVRLSFDSLHIARPMSFLVGADGVIRWTHVSRHQADPGDLDGALGAV